MRPSSENVLVAERVADARQAGLVLGGLELRRLEERDGLLDRRPALGRVQPLALRRSEDDVQHAALLGCELGLDQIGRLLRLRARDLELVAQLAADRPDQDDQEGDDADPAEDDPPGMRRARARPVREPTGRETFVRRAPFGLRFGSPLCSLIHLSFFALGFVLETGQGAGTHRFPSGEDVAVAWSDSADRRRLFLQQAS